MRGSGSRPAMCRSNTDRNPCKDLLSYRGQLPRCPEEPAVRAILLVKAVLRLRSWQSASGIIHASVIPPGTLAYIVRSRLLWANLCFSRTDRIENISGKEANTKSKPIDQGCLDRALRQNILSVRR